VVEDLLADARDPKYKASVLRDCIKTCYLRGDLKYSTIMTEGTFFQTFDKNPIAVITYFQLLYDHGRYQELVDKYKKLTKAKNAAYMTIVMASLCRLGTPEAYKQATHFLADEIIMPKEVEGGRAFEHFAWFSIQMGHYDAALETLKRKKQPTNVIEKIKSVKATTQIRTNLILTALVKSGKLENCLAEMSNQVRNYTKSGFKPMYSPELLSEIAKAIKHDEKLTQMYKELPNDLEEKGKKDTATVEELVFTPISASPHTKIGDKDFDNKNDYKKKFTPTFNSKDLISSIFKK